MIVRDPLPCRYPDCALFGGAFDLMNDGKPYACPHFTGHECGPRVKRDDEEKNNVS